MSDGPSLEVWFEFASTYSYLACARLNRLNVPLVADGAIPGPRILWKPFLLGPIFAAQGWNTSPFLLYEAKGRYMWRDMERLCAAEGLPFQRPAMFPQDSILAARVACLGEAEPWLPAFCEAVFRANFGDGMDISDPAVISAILASLNLEPMSILAAAEAPEARPRLRRNTEEAMRRGVFGAPTFFVTQADGRSEMFWGADRLDQALAWMGEPA